MLNLKKLLTKILDRIKTENLMDIFYPVGSYYETSDTSFDPNTAWGGTWSLENAGTFHISAGTGYTAGSTGGSPYIQAHTHSFTQPAYQIAANALTSSGMSANSSHSHGTGDTTLTDFVTRGSASTRRTVSYYSSGTNRGYTWTTDSTSSNAAIGSKSATNSVSVAHTHTAPSTAYTVPRTTDGSVGSINTSGLSTGTSGNLPPYVAVNRWHRTA